jgi:hypothetical protein
VVVCVEVPTEDTVETEVATEVVVRVEETVFAGTTTRYATPANKMITITTSRTTTVAIPCEDEPEFLNLNLGFNSITVCKLRSENLLDLRGVQRDPVAKLSIRFVEPLACFPVAATIP